MTAPILMGILSIVGLTFAIPKLRSYFAVEGATEGLRKELGEMLATERTKVVDLTKSLHEAREEIEELRKQTYTTLQTMGELKNDLRSFNRLCRSQRNAIRADVASGDVGPLKAWLVAFDDGDDAPTPVVA